MKLRALYISLLALLSLPTFAQNSAGNTYYAKPDSGRSQLVAPQKVQFGMELGTSIGTQFNGGAYLSTFVSPYLSYRVSPRWSFQVGATIINGNMGGFSSGYGDARSVAFAFPQQSTFVFAQGQYQASERLRLTGTSFYEVSRFNNSFNGNQRDMNFNSKGMSIYAEYKISENLSFGVGAQYSNGNQPYYNNGFGASRFGRPGPYMGW
jgi:hypothetical protein